MTRDYCLGFVTNVMLQDGDDHNHDPTVNWRLNINVERLERLTWEPGGCFFMGMVIMMVMMMDHCTV